MPLQHGVHRQVLADPAGRGRARPRSGATPSAIAAAPWVLAASSSPRRPVAALAQPELASTARSASRRQRSWLSSTGAAGVPVAVKRAALTGRSASQTSSPRSGLPLGLIPHATPAARNPAGRPALGPARARARARASSASERTAAAGRQRSGRPTRRCPRSCQPLRLGQAEHQVQVLDGLRGGALPEVVDRREHDHLAGVRVGGGEHAAEVRLATRRACPGGRSATSTNGSSCVGAAVQLAQLGRRRPCGWASRSSWPARPGRAAPGAPGTGRGRSAQSGIELTELLLDLGRVPVGRRPCRAGCSRRPSTGGSSRRTCARRRRCPAWRRSRRRRSDRRGPAARGRAPPRSGSSRGWRRLSHRRSARGAARSARRPPRRAGPGADGRRTSCS